MGLSHRFMSTSVPRVPMSIHEDKVMDYNKLNENLKIVRAAMGNKPLTLAEKIIYSHLDNPNVTHLSATTIHSRPSDLRRVVVVHRTPKP